MATVTISITRGNGTVLNASADVEDSAIVEMSGMIGAMIFDASYAEGGMPLTAAE